MDSAGTIEGISAITLATHDMARAVRFYHALGFEILYGGIAAIEDFKSERVIEADGARHVMRRQCDRADAFDRPGAVHVVLHSALVCIRSRRARGVMESMLRHLAQQRR